MFTFFTKVQQPSIYLLGTRIDEPVTALTGIFIAIVCAICCYKLRNTPLQDKTVRYMYWFIATLGISSFLGAVLGHAFQYQLGKAWKIPGWELAMISAFVLGQSSLLRYFEQENKPSYKNLTRMNFLSLGACSLLSINTLEFVWVEIYTAIGLLLIMSSLEYRLYKNGDRLVSPLLLWGMVPMIVSVLFIVLKFSVSPWFNYFDIAHLFICITVVYFYKALLAQAAYISTQTASIFSPVSNG